MNGAEKIKDRILADAENSKNKILDDANREAQSIIENAEKEAFQKVTIMTEKAREEALLIKQRFHAAEGMEDRKKVLKVRQDSVDEAFNIAISRLVNLSDEQYRLFLESIILDIAKEEAGVIALNEKDKVRLGENFLSNVNEKLKSKGKNAKLTLAVEPLNSCGGFILQYGDMELNSTFEILLTMARPSLESEVAAILFSE